MAEYSKLLQKVIRKEQDYLDYVKAGYEEWAKKKKLSDSKSNPPQFFTGSIASELAVISLNPHAGDAKPNSEIPYLPYCETWEEYLHFFSNFCYERYEGCASNVIEGLSNFDKELHCFFSGNKAPSKTNLAKWKIFHVEISHIATANFGQLKEESTILLSMLRALEAISLRKRSMVVLLNRAGCEYIKDMAKEKMLVVNSKGKSQKYRIIPVGEPKKCAQRIDYSLTLPNGKSIEVVATPTFPLRKVGNRFDFLESYFDKAFTAEEKKILKAGLGIAP